MSARPAERTVWCFPSFTGHGDETSYAEITAYLDVPASLALVSVALLGAGSLRRSRR